MAILKHIASKNSDYGEAERYLIFQHDEYTQKPILDEDGHMIVRDEYYLDGINCDPFSFASECQETNARFHKNRKYNEIKSHHYIISFDPKDRDECGLTGERAQQLGMEYAKKNFPGHQALVCTHTDGHNESGNIHVHIIINSVRKFDIEREPYMEDACDSLAGYKHHLTKNYLVHLKQAVMDLCHRENLNQVDLLTPAERRITESEYWAQRRGQEQLDKANQKMLDDGIIPRQTKFQTQKQYLRDAIEEAASTAYSEEDFAKLLSDKYHICMKISRGRYSYLHPERERGITGRNLGTLYERESLLQQFEKNADRRKTDVAHTTDAITEPVSDTIVDDAIPEVSDPFIPFIFIKSDLRLVIDIQHCVKAQQSLAYAQKVKLSNLQQMAQTVAYIQEHGIDTREQLLDALADASNQTSVSKQSLKKTEQELKGINEQIHYTGQYLANKNIYSEYRKSRNKNKFYTEHRAEITLYETALRILKEKSGNGKLPSLKLLREEKQQLISLRDARKEDFLNHQDQEKELRTVVSNVEQILGQQLVPKRQRDKSLEI